LVKLFPADHGGLAYLKAVRAPLRDIPLVPTGGVHPDNLADFLRAGAAAVGVGGALVPEHLLLAGDFAAIAANARRFAGALRQARMGDGS
jgi:2-dehydro-3-deoxyphosphogluconate aldolase/(4S)-4-hydroxy-2-oxoglutarate aldolase